MNVGNETRPNVGYGNRTAAALIDSVLLLIVTLPIQQAMSGAEMGWSGGSMLGFWDVIVAYVLPAIAILLFWKYRSATPGKMFMSAVIVDAATGGKPGTRQLLIRYVGYYIATIPLLLGLIWVAADPRKQGWHDKLAGTVVVSTASSSTPGADVSPRYAPTSPWTYVLCAPALLLLLALLAVIVNVALDPESLRAALAGIGGG
jgi:uncharacterized RDD family membrane protein YckC